MFNLLKKDKEAIFWKWFVKNKSKIEIFIQSDFSDYTIYNKLTKNIKSYNSILFPEITMTEKHEFVLVITPDGDIKGIEPTKILFDSKPEIENWIIQKYRQPCDEIVLNFNGIKYPSSDIEIIPEFEDKDKVDLRIFIRNLKKDEQKYKSLAFLYLDHILGEFNSITKVRYIDFFNLEESQSVEGGISLLELRRQIEHKLY